MPPRWVFWLGGLVLCALALYLLDAILLPFAAGFAIAYILDPLVGQLGRWRVPRGAAALIVLIGFFLVIALVLLILVPLLESQLGELIRRFPRFLDAARRDLAIVMGVLQERLSAEDFARLRDAAGARLGDAFAWFGQLLQGMLTSSLALFNLLSLVFITPIVAFFLLRDWRRIVTSIDGWLPRPHAATIRAQAVLVDRTLAGFMRGQAMVCMLMAAFYAVSLSLAGLDFGLVLGLLVGLLIFIPFLGGAIGAGLAILLAVTQFGDWTSIAVIAAIFLLGQTVEGNLLTPKLVGDRVHLHPVWVIFALLAFGKLFGLAGLIFAVPAAAVIGVLTRFALHRYLASPLYDPPLPVRAAEEEGGLVLQAPALPHDDEPIRL
ncbi:MAG: AI-2E family transporter [Alphaproteobacteria bacterium]|nr:AI-2E family transporter [Alphaproteobacteria bacterium]